MVTNEFTNKHQKAMLTLVCLLCIFGLLGLSTFTAAEVIRVVLQQNFSPFSSDNNASNLCIFRPFAVEASFTSSLSYSSQCLKNK